MSHLLDEVGQCESAHLNSFGGREDPGAINRLRKASVDGTGLEASLPLVGRPHDGLEGYASSSEGEKI